MSTSESSSEPSKHADLLPWQAKSYSENENIAHPELSEETVQRVTSYTAPTENDNTENDKPPETKSQVALRIAQDKAEFVAKYGQPAASDSEQSMQCGTIGSFDYLENKHVRLSLPNISSSELETSQNSTTAIASALKVNKATSSTIPQINK